MAITAARHVESVAGSGAAPVVVTCQRMGESPGIRRRRWSRFVAVIVACQGVVELCGIHRRKWSRAATVTAACQGMMELCGNLSQEVEQGRGRFGGLPGGADLLIEAR